MVGSEPILVSPDISSALSHVLAYLRNRTLSLHGQACTTSISNTTRLSCHVAATPSPSHQPSRSATATPSPSCRVSSHLTTPCHTPTRRSSPQDTTLSSPLQQSTPSRSPFGVTVEHRVKINRQTTLSVLYRYHDPQAYVEYPETDRDSVGYLFRRDPQNWCIPTHDFAYSLGAPSGRTKIGKPVTCSLLTTSSGELVPCVESHFTCQGSKVCPQTDIDALTKPHTSATLDAIAERLANDRSTRLESSSPECDIFRKTAALIAAVRKVGCRASECEATILPPGEQIHYDKTQAQLQKAQRGYKATLEKCKGRIVLKYYIDDLGQDRTYLKCEHYHKNSRDHYIHYLDESYDLDYLEAYFNEDTDELDRIEQVAFVSGFGPLAECLTVSNFSSQKLCCPCDHRLPDGQLWQPEMKHLACRVKFRIFEPQEEFRTQCPWILITSSGIHPHPIPLPQKTPPRIRSDITHLLERLGTDLADLTPRRFLRHPLVKDYLCEMLPNIPSPALSDLHVSLANRERLAYFIELERKRLYPEGTGWEGVKSYQENEDLNSLPEDVYIRKIIELPIRSLSTHIEDEPVKKGEIEDVRMVICMTKEGSHRILNAQYLQSDIGFKRVVGFYEFELACFDCDANTSVIFCRVFLNRQSAAAHEQLFHEIEEIVRSDTGKTLRWRHLHGDSADETDGMILQFAADQHPGQAKGLGLYLQNIAQKMEGKRDLHEPHRLLADLTAYEHLNRVFRLCTVHAKRNIHDARGLTDEVKNLMHSLICITHPNWDETLNRICTLGGKVGTDWVKNKIDSKFAFEGLCWEKSMIPWSVWKAGEANSNLVESAHADVNREGVSCSLLGGIAKGRSFDNMKMKTLRALETAGIRPSYKSGHLVENVTKNLKRKYQMHHNQLISEDAKIKAHNTRLDKARSSLSKIATEIEVLDLQLRHLSHTSQPVQYQRLVAAIEKAQRSKDVAQIKYDREIAAVSALRETGSGKVALVMS